MKKRYKTIHGRGSHGLVVFDAIQAAHPGAQIAWTDDVDTSPPGGMRPAADDCYICAIGDNRTRKAIGGTMTVIHPAAKMSPTAEIGQGVFVGAGVWIGPKAKIADGAIINNGAIVEHEVVVGPYAHVASGAVLSGRVRIGEGVLVGANATVRFGQSIGDWATIGCGAVVVTDVPGGEVWVGVPAKKLSS